MSLQGAQEFSTEVAASVAECFATITDFDAYPQWSSSVQDIRVLDRYPDGLARQVEFRISIAIKTIRYVLEYEYEPPHRLTWHAVDGDIDAIEGAYEFEKLSAKQSRATCRQAVSVGFWVPGPIRRMLEQSAVQQSVLEFKQAAEARAKRRSRKRS
ncbi:MAG TPA: SRPBCC family protein [Candidatus Kryptonia bacterium]|nr:SRPBCC family protein [Candidatus Kryptonia bacterium]